MAEAASIQKFGPNDRVLKPREVAQITSLSPTEIARRVREGEDFPRSMSLGERRRGFMLSDVMAWIQKQAATA